jgi:putative ABC transport system permease protein
MMRATWHLATNNLAGRPLRTALLLGAILASVTLMIAVASLLDTVDHTHRQSIGSMFGLGELRVVRRFQQRLSESLVNDARNWPEVATVSPSLEHYLALRDPETDRRLTIQALGIEPQAYAKLRSPRLTEGRQIRQAGEIVLDQRSIDRLGVKLGTTLEVVHFGELTKLTVTGILDRPLLGVVQQPLGMIMLSQAQQLAGLPGQVDEMEILLRSGRDANAIQHQYERTLPEHAMMQAGVASTANLSRNFQAIRMMLAMIIMLVYITASFIIAASLTTAVTQRLHELAILRSVGATRGQVALSQLVSGVLLTVSGTLAGIPVGLGLAWLVYRYYQHLLPGGFVPAWTLCGVALLASTVAGAAAALYPATIAARVSPVEGMAARAWKPTAKGIILCFILGLLLVVPSMMMIRMQVDSAQLFWLFIIIGVPAVLIGFIFLSIPVGLVVNAIVHRPVGWLLRVPGPLLGQGVWATPYRSGITASALMVSLALLVNVWMGGRSFVTGWFEQIRFPDAFVHSPTPIPQEHLQKLRTLSFVKDISQVTAFPVPTSGLGTGANRLMSPTQTLFVACDIESFAEMSNLTWVEGSREESLAQLKQGQALLVSREFVTLHRIGLGQQLTLRTAYGPQPFRVVGVVSSPGIEVATQFYGIGRNFSAASVGSVIGTNEDARHFWGVDSANLVLISIDKNVSDSKAIGGIRWAMPGLLASSARRIRAQANKAANDLMSVASVVAGVGLAISCLAVGNLILAGIHARRFEFGVLRSIGAKKTVVVRLIIGQTIVIAINGCLLGVIMGATATLVSQHLYQSLLGIHFRLIMPWDVVLYGSVVVIFAAILSALPALWQVWRMEPRDLLASD